MIKRMLKATVTSVTGLVILMLVTGFLVTHIGSMATGSIENWKAAMKGAAPILTALRLTVYSVTAYFGWQAYDMYRRKENQVGMARMKRLGLLGGVVILFIEVPKLIGLG